MRAVIASATVLACLAAGWAIGASTYAGPDFSPVAAEPSSPAAVIHGIFVGDSLPAVDPGPAVTDGYTPQSFRLVAGEVAAARRVYERYDWPSIDVSRRSIEETAATILNMLTEREPLP